MFVIDIGACCVLQWAATKHTEMITNCLCNFIMYNQPVSDS